MIDAFFEQRAMNHATVWVDPSTDAVSGEEKIAQLQNCLRYSMERTMRLEEQKAQLLEQLKVASSHHARYVCLKTELFDVLSPSMIDRLIFRLGKREERCTDCNEVLVDNFDTSLMCSLGHMTCLPCVAVGVCLGTSFVECRGRAVPGTARCVEPWSKTDL